MDNIVNVPAGSSGRFRRAIFVGAFLSLLLSVVAPYGSMMIHPADISADFATPGAIFFFFAFLVVIGFLRLIHKRFDFSESELIIIYSMMIVAAAIPTYGLVERFPSLLTGFYFAAPENRWAEIIYPYTKPWMVPQDPLAIKYFYEGVPKGVGIPWGAWAGPLVVVWLPFILVLYFVMICIMAILRKQWVENERLIFPLAQLPLEMIKEGEEGSLVRPFLKDKLMWLGFIIPFTISSWNALHNYFLIPLIGRGSLTYYFSILRGTTAIVVKIRFVAIGLAYFVNLNVSLGVWLFCLLMKIQRGIFNVIGFQIEGHSGLATKSQGMGAMIVLVLFGLWAARLHLRDVFRKAFRGDAAIDDRDELLSYRTAVFGIIGGLTFMSLWLRRSGLPLFVTIFFLFGVFVVFLGLTRIVSQGGVGFAKGSQSVQDFTIRGLGSSALGPVGIVALGFTHVWTAQRTFVMASTANALGLSKGVRMGGRRILFWALIIAILVSLCGSIWTVWNGAYSYGGMNLLNDWLFRRFPMETFDSMAHSINNPVSVSWGRWAFTGIGAVIMALLILMVNRFPWWPIHYIGFPIAATYPVEHLWFSIFIAWLLKALVLKYGGLKLYRRTRSFFLGLILGQISCAGMWLVIDFFTGKVGNIISTGVY